eukprot:m.309612 g.309612  ORF g.309612 m.309612 type:complete len:58 (+) comp47090_c0_seq1:3874-4047(+)
MILVHSSLLTTVDFLTIFGRFDGLTGWLSVCVHAMLPFDSVLTQNAFHQFKKIKITK